MGLRDSILGAARLFEQLSLVAQPLAARQVRTRDPTFLPTYEDLTRGQCCFSGGPELGRMPRVKYMQLGTE